MFKPLFYFVAAIDNEPPYYTYCPQKIAKDFVPKPPYPEQMRVSWDEAIFKDNSGKDPTAVPSTPNGALFREGQHQVIIILYWQFLLAILPIFSSWRIRLSAVQVKVYFC